MQEPSMFDDTKPADTEIIQLITSEQKAMVMNELHRLFAFHRERVSEEERGMFAADLCSGAIPYKAILKGIRELQESKSKTATEFWSIKESCQHAAAEIFTPERCEACDETGTVTMIRTTGEFIGSENAFACLCPNGKRWLHSTPRIPSWNGLEKQSMMDSRNGVRTAVDFVLFPRHGGRPEIQREVAQGESNASL